MNPDPTRVKRIREEQPCDMSTARAVAWKEMPRELTDRAESPDDIKAIILHLINTTRFKS